MTDIDTKALRAQMVVETSMNNRSVFRLLDEIDRLRCDQRRSDDWLDQMLEAVRFLVAQRDRVGAMDWSETMSPREVWNILDRAVRISERPGKQPWEACE